MHLYSGLSTNFVADATQNRIAGKIDEAFFAHFRYRAPQSEVRSWRNSLRAMAECVNLGGFDDHGVIVEWQLPLSSKRLDVMLTGHDDASRASAVIVELKQWDGAKPSAVEDCVLVDLGGGEREVLHPSRQVGNYQRYLLDTHTSFSSGDVALTSCAYAHNLVHISDSELFADRHRAILGQFPLFAGDQVDSLTDFLNGAVSGGGGGPVLEKVLSGRYRPHKRLLQHTASVIANNPEYVLLDEQQVVFNSVLAQVRARQLGTTKSVFLVRGGPGTGKSVVAVNLLAALCRQGYSAHYATGSRAFTENLRKVVGRRAGALFNYFNSYTDIGDVQLDALILDESHRIRERSGNRFTPQAKRSTVLQVDELIGAAKTTVFFIDDRQVVRPGEVGSTIVIKDAARRLGVDVVEHELATQFRCAGSDAYVSWIENTLGIRRTEHVLWDDRADFDFDIVDSPEELEALVRARNSEGVTARLSAGFCWPWSDPRSDGSLVADVAVDTWSMPWNAKPDARKLAPGIPKSHYWASDPAGIDQVGCVYTAQGFEYHYAGVVWGRDLVYRPGQGWVGQPQFSHDTVVKRAKADFVELVKNTYRVLLTRGLLGCYVYFEDGPTRDFVLSRVERPDA